MLWGFPNAGFLNSKRNDTLSAWRFSNRFSHPIRASADECLKRFGFGSPRFGLALGVGAFNCDVTEKLCYVTVSFSVHFALCPPSPVSGYLISPPFVLFVFFLYDFALFIFLLSLLTLFCMFHQWSIRMVAKGEWKGG